MKYGLPDRTLQKIQGVLSHYPQIESAILYGSRATGTYRNGSDIDLTLCGDTLTHSILSRIDTELDDLLLPYTIDLSIFHQIDNPDMVEQIQRIGVNFYEKY
ncbi:nucleotidyltransferase domain-containing protein [Candidatus Poribacteria bacterium]|nr:nucleotidyltransferase domain-containing protein [Candidatus Poribacteria bacterium]MYA69931.1 nucleotidyltransferase domain-containing protein [Candidatus Poribacteria bacterium]MYH82385.1 nucleotidyltransferase domain-containing protein [Candidatus Poribacteria bacterium]MYK93881.1 nucleotidyltransferase domain-containing protein [Candidatus Poribacteria bacterium]